MDLYWDVSRSTWSFCPVELGEANPGLSSTQDGFESQTPAGTASLESAQLTQNLVDISTTGGPPVSGSLQARQTGESLSLPSSGGTSAVSTSASILLTATSTATLTTDATTTGIAGATQPATSQVMDGETMIQVGPYTCSPALDFRTLLSVLNGHLDNTEDSLNATMKYLALNLHVASSTSDPMGSPDTPSMSNLPRNRNQLSNLIASNNSQYLYTPELLESERSNLNVSGSWFGGERQYFPNTAYYQLNHDSTHSSTPNGWPSEGFVELANARRFLAGYNQIDDQLSGYNFSGDAASIFQQGYLQDPVSVSFTQFGSLAGGCFFDAGITTLASVNASWATAAAGDLGVISPSSVTSTLAQASNLTACGITPILNATLLNATADENFAAYKAYVMSTIWSWDTNEPRNHTSNDEDSDSSTANRCAVLNATSARWQTEDCSATHHAACRVSHQPYEYRISDASISYTRGEDACNGDTSFAVPRTGLENTYLLSTFASFRSSTASDNDDASPPDELLWLDFNDLDSASCWVIGQNSTCPYQAQSMSAGRTVVVPTVAAVIVFAVALAVVVVKCASNRRSSKRRRKRGDDGWDYEGVPS